MKKLLLISTILSLVPLVAGCVYRPYPYRDGYYRDRYYDGYYGDRYYGRDYRDGYRYRNYDRDRYYDRDDDR